MNRRERREAAIHLTYVNHQARPDRRFRQALQLPEAQAIVQAPALFNRARRRAIGMWGSIWRWDTNGTEMERTFVPRYIRRHQRWLKGGNSRKVRRERARVIRMTKARLV